MVIGTMYGSSARVATDKPSTADKTLIAGVIIPSPNSNPAAIISNAPKIIFARDETLSKRPYKANTPPSPSLSALITKMIYLIEIRIVSAQNTKLIPPKILSTVGALCECPKNIWLIAYSGEVPISPKTTPNAPSESAKSFFFE